MPSAYDTTQGTARDERGNAVELHPPVDHDGWYASQVRDWVGVCPELGDSAVRFYLILRSLVIDKHGPVRKLTLVQLCHLLPRKAVAPGRRPDPSSLSRIRSLLDQLTGVGLVTTPEGHRLTTSSRALAAGRGLRLRINLMPRRSYDGPRNAFDYLDEIRPAAAEAALAARARELELAATRRRAGREEAGGAASVGRIPDPEGRISDPRGQISDPPSVPDQQKRDIPLSPSAQSSRPLVEPSVRPSPQEEKREPMGTEGRDGRKEEPAIERESDDRQWAGIRTTPDGKRTEPEGEASDLRGGATPGLDVLYRLGARIPALALAGRPLTDQAMRLDDLLTQGRWTPESLLAALSAPFEGPVRVSAGAVVSARINSLPAAPASAHAPAHELRRSVAEEYARRVMPECAECGRPPESGTGLCAECAGWLVCPSCRRTRTADGSLCASCAESGHRAEPVGECVGHGGTCGAPLLEIGPLGPLCGRCEFFARRSRADRDARWADVTRAAAATVAAEEASSHAGRSSDDLPVGGPGSCRPVPSMDGESGAAAGRGVSYWGAAVAQGRAREEEHHRGELGR